ncbi:uncharacterized protein [Canis lupus baileyi]
MAPDSLRLFSTTPDRSSHQTQSGRWEVGAGRLASSRHTWWLCASFPPDSRTGPFAPLIFRSAASPELSCAKPSPEATTTDSHHAMGYKVSTLQFLGPDPQAWKPGAQEEMHLYPLKIGGEEVIIQRLQGCQVLATCREQLVQTQSLCLPASQICWPRGLTSHGSSLGARPSEHPAIWSDQWCAEGRGRSHMELPKGSPGGRMIPPNSLRIYCIEEDRMTAPVQALPLGGPVSLGKSL